MRPAAAGDLPRDLDVAAGREGRQQVEFLKDEADAGAAHLCPLGVVEGGEVDAADEDAAGGGAGEAAEQVEERRLAAARRADNADKLAGSDFKGRVAERRNFEPAGSVDFAEVLGANHRIHSAIVNGQESP